MNRFAISFTLHQLADSKRGLPPPLIEAQGFMRQIVRASLPMSEGTILDPFMGSGSTIAAATACGLDSIGVEIDAEYFELAQSAIPQLVQYIV